MDRKMACLINVHMKTLVLLFIGACSGQMISREDVKITSEPFPVQNSQRVQKIVWTMVGTITKEQYYCVSVPSVSQLRLFCIDCFERNVTTLLPTLNAAQDISHAAGFPTLALRNVAVDRNWTGVHVVCQALVNGVEVNSEAAVVEVRYLRQPLVVDENGQQPIQLADQGNRFYVECIRAPNGICTQGRRKTLRCKIEAYPPATVFRWLKNGVPVSGSGQELSIGPEMIGQSVQCQGNNNLYAESEMPTSQAVQIDPYSSARLIMDNFQAIQGQRPFQSGGRIDIGRTVQMGCQVEGNPRPVVFWRLRRGNGQVVNADCPQGYEGQYTEVNTDAQGQPLLQNPSGNVRLNAVCNLQMQNYSYSGTYWCAACSYVSRGIPECSPGLEAPSGNTLTVNVQGPPMESEQLPYITKNARERSVTVHVPYCSAPKPTPPRDIKFLVDENEIQLKHQWNNFEFSQNIQNNTHPNCYSARLLLKPVSSSDQHRDIQLRLQNPHGKKIIPVRLGKLMGDEFGSDGISGWWIALIVLALLSLAILLCCLCFCYIRRMVCFGRQKRQPTHISSTQKETKYSANLAPQQFVSEPVPSRPQQTYAPPSYQAAPALPEKRAHEGVNYAELDLTDQLTATRDNRTVGFLDTDYAHLRAPSSDSIV